jgi:hypothetical protein
VTGAASSELGGRLALLLLALGGAELLGRAALRAWWGEVQEAC